MYVHGGVIFDSYRTLRNYNWQLNEMENWILSSKLVVMLS